VIRRNRKTHWAAKSLGLAAILIATAATPALAAPELEVELERDAAVVNHADERLDYTVEVKNTAPAGLPTVAGDTLGCSPNLWFNSGVGPEDPGFIPPTFAYQWLRNGEPIGAATTDTYATSTTDEGKVIQCQLRVTNTKPDIGDATNFVGRIATVKGVVVDPQPATAPPTPPQFIDEPEQTGALDGSATQELTCNAGSWGGAPTVYTYRWYRNGHEYGAPTIETAATSASVAVPAADQAPAAVFQCTVTGINAGGAVAKASRRNTTTSPGPDPKAPINAGVDAGSTALDPVVTTANYTRGTLTVEIELPGGEETYAYQAGANSWSCDRVPATAGQHARAICTSSVSIAPEASAEPLKVITALGADASDQAIAKATVSGGGAPAPASDVDEFTFEPAIFKLESFEAKVVDAEGNDYTKAGGHAFAGIADFEFSRKRVLLPENPTPLSAFNPVEHIKQVITDVPRGFVGNARAVPELCAGPAAVLAKTCPEDSMIGGIEIRVTGADALEPIYAIEHEFGTPAQFAFSDPLFNVYTLSARLRPEEGYAVSFELAPAPKTAIMGSTVTFCNFGAKSFGSGGVQCHEADEPGSNPIPLFTNPTRCDDDPPVTVARVNSWEHPDQFIVEEFTNAPITECEAVKFEPKATLVPTNREADSPTGLDVEVKVPTEGLEDPKGISQAHMKRVRVTFPEGMSVNASAGHGLGSCSAQQVKLKTNDPISCPESSKFGSLEIETPILENTLEGDVYIAKQGDVGGALIGFYIVFDSKEDGILIKIPARVDPDPVTGQLVVTVDESPEAPFSKATLHFPSGPRATLLNPPKCGSYEIKTEISPWSAKDPDNPTAAETVTQTSPYEVTQGPNGGPCPSGELKARMSAGTTNPLAGQTSPFVVGLDREDGTQRFKGLSMQVPRGITAYLRGVPYCPEQTIASIKTAPGTGQAEIDNPSCPAASQVGTAAAGAGAGPNPLYVDTGKLYLAGPYKGAPASLVLVAPAVAGPLDLGSVVVRTAIYIDPETARITAVSDPIPTMLHGILLGIRDIRVNIDRPNFTLNPTSCEEKSVDALITGESGATLNLANRFQVGGCENLGFKPTTKIELIGGTKRGAHPGLRGVLSARAGDANIGRIAVTIPRSEFLDQAHIRTICTRVQFAAKQCPKGSLYGYAKAFTPLLDFPVEGPVYLRSSSNKLPDLVVAVRGPEHQPIESAVVGRIDSIRGQIRTIFESVPDVPLSKVILTMQGGEKGLLVNSRDICAERFRANVKMTAQNGRAFNSRPVMRNRKCGKGRKGRR
jgi:hypothetical protein